MTQQQNIRKLLERYMNNSSSEEELEELEGLLADFSNEQVVKSILEENYHALKEEDIDPHIGLAAKERIFNFVTRQEEQSIKWKTHKRNWFIAASVAVILVLFSIVFFQQKEQSDGRTVAGIQPGSNKALLTLGDGKKILLGEVANGDIAQEVGVKITKMGDGQLVYEVKDKPNVHSPITYNTIETPNGGRYQVRLPDGTVVWLNASSQLKYPTSFAAHGERRVQLLGEGYFEVAKDKARPFLVYTDQQVVEVLGTHFNINAYRDEGYIRTTLLEGSVKVRTIGGETKILTPGEQAVNNKGHLDILPINSNYAIAWKEGYFRFDGKDLEEGMREIARWYDVKITYKKESLKKEPLAGRISKYDNIRQVLKKIELAGIVNFSVKGREIIVE